MRSILNAKAELSGSDFLPLHETYALWYKQYLIRKNTGGNVAIATIANNDNNR